MNGLRFARLRRAEQRAARSIGPSRERARAPARSVRDRPLRGRRVFREEAPQRVAEKRQRRAAR